MKITLINPCWEYPLARKGARHSRIWPPLCLANCAALLERENFQVTIIDANAERLSPDEVAARARGADRIFITSSALDRWQCPHTDLKPFLRTVEKLPLPPFVMGTHGTLRPEYILELTGAAAVIRGEPEQTVLRLCRHDRLADIAGLTYQEDGQIISTKDAGPLAMTELPVPAWHLLPLHRYFYEVLGDNFLLFETSRGCPFQCSYCQKAMYGAGLRKKETAQVLREVAMAIERFGVKTAYFIDLEFTINRTLVEELCDFLIAKKYDFRWCCQTRLDTVDPPLLAKMKKAGCELIHYGVESGSERLLRLIRKNLSLRQIREGIAATHQAKIKTACFFLLGLPTETEEEMEETIRLAREFNPDYASFHIWTPYPGTVLHEAVKDDLTGQFPEVYTGLHSLVRLQKIKRRAFLRFYLSPRYLRTRLLQGDFYLLIKQFRLFFGYLRSSLFT